MKVKKKTTTYSGLSLLMEIMTVTCMGLWVGVTVAVKIELGFGQVGTSRCGA